VRVARGGRVGVRVARPGWGARPGRGGAELGRDLAGEHPPDAETEQMRRVTAVGPGDDVAAGTRRAAWTAMAGGTAVGEPRADGQRRAHVAHAVADPRTLPLGPGELPLRELAPAADPPEGIATDDEQRGVRSQEVAPPGADLLGQGLVDPLSEDVGRLGAVDELGARGGDRERAAHGQGEPQADPEAARRGGPEVSCQRTSKTGHRFTSRAVSRTLAGMCRASAGCVFGDRDSWARCAVVVIAAVT